MGDGSYVTLALITDIHLRHETDGDPTHPDAHTNIWYYYAGSAKLRKFRDYVNNSKEIDYAVCLGDMGDRHRNDVSMFMSIWNTVTKPKVLTIGNHDIYDLSYAETLDYTGYANKPEIAGSKYNQSFVISGKGNAKIRVIMIDSNQSPTGHQASNEGWMTEATRSWVSTECDASKENVIVFISHHAPHQHFRSSPDGFQAYAGMMSAIKKKHPYKKFLHLSGHEHNFRNSHSLHRSETAIPNISINPLLDYLPAKITLMKIYENGHVEIGSVSAHYPYP